MANAYKVIRFYEKTELDIVKEIAMLFSGTKDFVQFDNGQVFLIRFKDDYYLLNIDKIFTEYRRLFYTPILTNYKFLDLLQSFSKSNIRLLNISLSTKGNTTLSSNYTEYLVERAIKNEYGDLKEMLLEDDDIRIKNITFKLNNSSKIVLSESGLFNISREDLDSNKKELFNVVNFIYSGVVYE